MKLFEIVDLNITFKSFVFNIILIRFCRVVETQNFQEFSMNLIEDYSLSSDQCLVKHRLDPLVGVI